MSDLDKVLEERGKNYGPVNKQWALAQRLKEALDDSDRDSKSGQAMPIEKEALDMICTKLSRLACGNAHDLDTWQDIAGYATLVANDLKEARENAP